MKLIENEIFHVYNRGNQQQKIFFVQENYFYFLRKIRYHLHPICDLLAYCLMPNHFHLLVKTNSQSVAKPIKSHPIGSTVFSKEMGKMLSSYTRAIQKQENFKGSLFQQKTKAKQVSGNFMTGEDYVITCFRYILNNPVKSGLVSSPGEWEFSSYRDLVQGRKDSLCSIDLINEELSLNLNTLDDILGILTGTSETNDIF